jgi:hypothetical protein
MAYFIFILQFLLCTAVGFSQSTSFMDSEYPYREEVDTSFLYTDGFQPNEIKDFFVGRGYYTYTQNKRILGVFSEPGGDSVGFRTLFYPNGHIKAFINLRGNNLDGKAFYFDLKGRLKTNLINSNNFRTAEYLIKGHHIRMKVNHMAKKGTRRTWCFRRIPKEDREFVEMLKRDPLVIKNCSTQ